MPTSSALEAERALVLAATRGEGRVLSRHTDRCVVAFDDAHRVVKVFWRRAGLRGFLDFIFGGRGVRTSMIVAAARQRRVAVAAVTLLVREQTFEAVVFERIDGETVDAARSAPFAARRARAVELAWFLRSVHDAGMYPGDFHAGNVLFGAEGPVLIDLEGVKPTTFSVSTRRRVRNIECLLRDFLGERRVSRALRWRFVRAYASSKEEARSLWYAIDARSQKKRSAYDLPSP